MTQTDALDLMANARKAQTLWAALSHGERKRKLSRLRQTIAESIDSIVALLAEETNKLPLDALAGDIAVTLEQMRYYEKYAGKILRSRKVGKVPFFYFGSTFQESYKPHGVALIFAPWNYPLQLSMIPLITALFAGNAVILKSSELTPKVGAAIADLCKQSLLPEFLVQVSAAGPEDAGMLLQAQPDVVFFTGSSTNGSLVARQAAEKLIPTILELGGKDAALVFADCNMERTLGGVLYGAFSHSGQVCVGIKRLYVEHTLYAEFLAKLVERTRSLRVGKKWECDISGVFSTKLQIKLKEQVQDALQRGALLHCDWKVEEEITQPLILSNVPEDAALFQEESFGPVLCVAPFHSDEEAIALANGSAFALGNSIWTQNRSRAKRIAQQLSSGVCAINDVIRDIANPYASFGGNKRSGYGRYHGPDGLLSFSRKKTIMQSRSWFRHEIHWFPYSKKAYEGLRRVLLFRHGPSFSRRCLRRLLGLGVIALLCFLPVKDASSEKKSDGHLYIEVALPAHAVGELAYLVFRDKSGFPSDREKAFRHGFIPLPEGNNGKLRFDIGELTPANYAVSIYLDVNKNKKLDHNWIGIPKEPVGASMNPKSRMGPPAFHDCVFPHGSLDETITIMLVH